MRTSRRLAIATAVAATAMGLAACSGIAGSGAIGNGTTSTAHVGQKEQGGTATIAWPDGRTRTSSSRCRRPPTRTATT